jgi:hypothetical protein
MKKVCAWCGKILEQGSCKDAEITHGICPACQAAVLASLGDLPAVKEKIT